MRARIRHVFRTSLGTLLISVWLAGAARAAAPDPNQDIKDKQYCSAPGVLCVDVCSGNVLGKQDGPTATSKIERGGRVQVKLVGHCNESATTFAVSVAYYANLDTLNKSATTAAPGAMQTADLSPATWDAGTRTFFRGVSFVLGGQPTDAMAEVIIERKGAAAAPVPPPLITGINWGMAHADYMLQDGRYYLDFGVGLAIVRKGAQQVVAAPYRGNQDDLRLSTENSTPANPLFCGFIYPFGRKRNILSSFGDGGWSGVGDLIVIQVGTELSRQNLLRSVYLGGGLELVSGMNLVFGAALVPVTDYRSGARAGMLVQDVSEAASVTRQVNVIRWYLALSASTEVFNLAKAAYASAATN